MIDEMIAEKTGGKVGVLRQTTAQRAEEVNALQNKVQTVEQQTDDVPDTGQTIIVSTAENKLYVRRDGQTVFQAVCSTGKGTELKIDGRTRSEEHTSELQSQSNFVCRLLLEKKNVLVCPTAD